MSMTLERSHLSNPKISNPMQHFVEIFPLSIQKLNTTCFRLSPDIDREIGNRLSWRFSQQFPDIVVIWHQKFFWVLNKLNQEMPSKDEWKQALENIQKELKQEIGDREYIIQLFPDAVITSEIQAQLAAKALKITRPFAEKTVYSQNQVNVNREVKFWEETVEINNITYPALSFTTHSNFTYAGNLANFYKNHPYRQNIEKLLIGLKVRDIEHNSFATITEIAGQIGELGEKLITEAKGAISKQSLLDALENEPEQPVVAVKFGRDSKLFQYAMAALRPCITVETANKFDVNYGDLLKASKISYSERKELLSAYKEEANQCLNEYGIQICNALNSDKFPDLFFTPSIELNKTPLLFGKNITGIQGEILKGLSKGGVYSRHADFADASKPIILAALKLFDTQIGLIKDVRERLEKYGFESLFPDENRQTVSMEGLSGSDARAKVEDAVNEIMENEPDIVFVFLPTSDRTAEDNDSLYSWVSSRLLRRGIASQVIYEDTLQNVESKYLLNQVIPGILAKLGNLPFVLAEDLLIADYFIGLDVSRGANRRNLGSRNACASVRLYGKHGEFTGYRLESETIEGEEIPQRVLENLLPKNQLMGKRILIYRDGRFCGDEVKHLQARAKAIGATFILVECAKSGIPRLYNWSKPNLTVPTQGLGLKLSQREAILVTTSVTEKMGLPVPLRLKIIDSGGLEITIQDLVNTTLKLTLLHHGSLKAPRLPVPLFGSDRIAYRRLQGIYPGTSEGDRQFWL
jgi:Piwi domain